MDVPHLRSQAAAAAASKCVSARPKMQTELHPHQANAIKSKANFGYQRNDMNKITKDLFLAEFQPTHKLKQDLPANLPSATN